MKKPFGAQNSFFGTMRLFSGENSETNLREHQFFKIFSLGKKRFLSRMGACMVEEDAHLTPEYFPAYSF